MAFRPADTPLYFVVLASVLLPVAIGCGDGRPQRVPVAGQVLIDGKPLSFGYIGFVPENARPSVAKLDAQGRFTMSCFDAADGVVVGKHAVEVIAREPIGEDTLKWHAPKKYASIDSSGLSEEITAPTDSLTIRLTWDGQPGPFVEVLR